MSRETITFDDQLVRWLHSHTLRETPVQRKLRDEMADHAHGGMQTAPEQVQFMQVLLWSIEARHVVEIGVFTGYSALGMALALPEDGRLVACDVSQSWLDEAHTWWTRAGVADRIESRCGPGAESLRNLLDEGWASRVDLIYADADKTGSETYFELGMQLLRPGGLFTVDNMLRAGRVADPDVQDESTVATRALVTKLQADERVDWTLVPIGDGLGIARKR